ncbi:MAG: c-type cytochrome [Oligoflexales bacterium]
MYKAVLAMLFITNKLLAVTQAYTGPIEFGRPATLEELSTYPRTHFPDGENLPAGQGNYAEGKQLYQIHCVSCHGPQMKGKAAFNAPRLIGGRGSLKGGDKPIKTVESFWPHAVSLYDYISRAMPFLTPKILTANEVYALCAYILAEAHIIPKTTLMDETSLPKVAMPNKDGFIDPYTKQRKTSI